MVKRLLLASSSRCHPHGYLEHCEAEVSALFADADEVVFVPYARPGGHSLDAYTAIARRRLQKMGFGVRGIHEFEDPRRALQDACGVFVGGGNSFVLLRELYRHDLLDLLRDRIVSGVPYLGTSAGSNIAGVSIGTSNDMPIVHPPSFAAVGAVAFNINPHFPHTPPDPTHKGETREDRIAEFHVFNAQPVIGLHEDGMLQICGNQVRLIGERDAHLFRQGEKVHRLPVGVIPEEALPVEAVDASR